MRELFLRLLLAVLACGCAGMSQAADKYAVGVNSLFIMGYAKWLGRCPGCPGNVQPHTLSEIDASVLDLVANQHVGTFREIVPLTLFSPNGTNNRSGSPVPMDSTHYDIIDAVLSIYRKYNVHLILAAGLPAPQWMIADWQASAPPQSNCILPTDATNKYTFKNNVSWAFGNYLGHLKQLGFGTWMAGGPPGGGGLFAEPFNEFNGLASGNCIGNVWGTPGAAAQPAGAAELAGGLSYVMAYWGVPATLTAPSTAYQGSGWWSAYYQSGGVGVPNFHIYINDEPPPQPTLTYVQAYQTMQQRILEIYNAVPSQFRNKLIVGEVGFSELAGPCTTADPSRLYMDSANWAYFNTAAAQVVTGLDAVSTAAVQLLAVWRLDRISGVPSANSCEATFGIVDPTLKNYLPAGVNMFRYLGGTGNSRP